jgi:DtxR family Mn-dependent transcriptional regulator
LPQLEAAVDKNVISHAMEDYIKAIYKAHGQDQQVPTSVLAENLGVAPASVTNMCKKLAELNLIEYEPYQGVKFTSAGAKVALEIIRHHRLIELFLAEALGVPWDQVHDEAEKLEHVISEDLEDRMAAVLGDPKYDPHGAPIPTRSGKVYPKESGCLVDMKAGDKLIVVEVDDDDPELLRYVGGLGIFPGTELTLLTQAPFEGPLTLKIDGSEFNLGYQAAKSVLVALQE